MSHADILLHLLNLAAPAFALAVLVPLLSWPLFRRAGAPRLWVQMTLDLLAGLVAALASIWWLGRDGKMMGYAVLVLSVATMQWLLLRGWRR